jgi:hypothetical protein
MRFAGPKHEEFKTAMTRLRRIALNRKLVHEDDLLALCHYYLAFGQRLIGERGGKPALLEEAKQNLRQTLRRWTFDRAPHSWAKAQLEYGNICVRLGRVDGFSQV